MFTPITAPASPSFPPLNDLLSALSRVDWRHRFTQLVLLAATVAAVLVAVSTFLYRNARAFWAEHGEEITLRFELFIEWLVEAIEKTHQAGAASRPVAVRALNRLADWLFYQLAV
jgi:hypothetical protein